MDSTANNYNPLANIPSGDCDYSIGIKNISGNGVAITVVPNPFNGVTEFVLSGKTLENGEIRILNSIGEQLASIAVNNKTNRYIYRNNELAAGIYYYMLVSNNRTIAGGKLIAE